MALPQILQEHHLRVQNERLATIAIKASAQLGLKSQKISKYQNIKNVYTFKLLARCHPPVTFY